MPKIEPVRCVCGAMPCEEFSEQETATWMVVDMHRVRCQCGWEAPWRHTINSARKAWNRVMTAAKEVKDASSRT